MSSTDLRSERFVIEGRVDHATFPDWIDRHARKLGIFCGPIEAQGNTVTFSAEGAPDMLDAMEMGCSLGPITVDVRRIDRRILTE
ncbi:acylphosphatase [Palleronia sp. LCG004]|uniref:acylphosphatase n=1 Tax=Palleronia sp. LCG004 TaxID=3079304 RepID=UPI0029432146|nr:acylphosphatase [Palleronia sp. LCG004]WOI56444.1 acylphosphatase [Palleronia sp. LCG004]